MWHPQKNLIGGSKGKQAKDAKEMHKEFRKQNEYKKDKYDRDDAERGKHDEVRERLREKKASSEQKELEHLSDTAQDKRKKW